ncbi:phage regulatory protein/antirepressor Ant [Mycobacterium sp. 852013-50091_SCH5140682]|uniref:phage regulatory protein/antirepressor Ant n=1 Tax=Mycobacterium sp. 852013-50091_SCH5140682 TaxID=1834109 RepID=UPI000B261C9B|nr:phage regulatory protein/antirepressor Ant [Mycobacterium sp. 852013-50091_SCH5140682]
MSELETTGNELVQVGADGEPFTTSLVIAAETSNQHKNVLALIRKHVGDLNEVGRVAFETRPFETAGGTQRREVALLDEPAAALLITNLGGSKVVFDFRKRLVAGFYAMRQMLAERAPIAPVIALPDRRQLAQMVIEEADRADAAEAQVRELTAPARSWQLLADAKGDFSVAEAAKILSRDPSITTGRDRLFQYMADQKWVFKSRNPRGGWEAYQTAVDTGRLVEKPAKPFLNSRTGAYELPAPTIRVTAKGVGKLHELMGGTEPIRFVVGEAS